MKHMVLRNAWYAAETSSVLTNNLHGVRILGEDVLLYRKEDGAVAALEDACPHRKVPLSLGKHCGDFVQCAYHGLTFAASGSCVRALGSRCATSRLAMTRFPLLLPDRSCPARSRRLCVRYLLAFVPRLPIQTLEPWKFRSWVRVFASSGARTLLR